MSNSAANLLPCEGVTELVSARSDFQDGGAAILTRRRHTCRALRGLLTLANQVEACTRAKHQVGACPRQTHSGGGVWWNLDCDLESLAGDRPVRRDAAVLGLVTDVDVRE